MTEFDPGDIVEIETRRGRAYAQVTHHHASYPPVVRVFPGRHAERPGDFEAIARTEPEFRAMLPLAHALGRSGLAHRRVAQVAIPAAERDFPVFRTPIRDKQGTIVYWWLWDGRGLRYETELDEAGQAMPIREVMPVERFLDLLDGEAESV